MGEDEVVVPMEFHCPDWYEGYYYAGKRRVGEICWRHEICELIEQNLDPRPHTAEFTAEREKQWEIRRRKRHEFYMNSKQQEENNDDDQVDDDVDDDVDDEEILRMREERERTMKRMEESYLMRLKNPTPIIQWTIEEGERYDVLNLLSSSSRDYLINNKGHKVQISQLSQKHLVLYFSCLTNGGRNTHDRDSNTYVDLEEIYSAYQSKGMLEVVFIALGNDEHAFCDTLSRMPWLAIPHQDQEARDFFRTKFAIPDSAFETPVLFDPYGTVLLKDALGAFRAYGAEGFPFTKQRIKALHKEASGLWNRIVHKKQKIQLNALLGNTLVSSDGNQVSTYKLKGKTVGLYFFKPGALGFSQAREILKMWKLLKDKQCDNFEIVLVNEASTNHRFSKSAFKNEFGSMPWYSLPFDGRKLCQIFKLCGIRWDEDLINPGFFIVLQADKYQSLSYFAYDILETFGVDSYPFTLESAVRTAMIEQQKTIVLSKLLSPLAPLLRGSSTGYKEDMTVSHLSGKRVLLLFATHFCYEVGSYLPRLKRMYNDKKGTSGEFEVVYISMDCDEKPSSFLSSIQLMPWLFHPFVPDFAVTLYEKVFQYPPHLPAIAEFGPDGHLQTKASNLSLKAKWKSTFPFIQTDMAEEVHKELVHRYKWDLNSLFSS